MKSQIFLSPVDVSQKKKVVLIVDDSDFIRERLVAMFDDYSEYLSVLQAKNSTEAFEKFHHSSPDLVILDIRIPGDNGIKVLENLKKIKPEVKIIMLTNYGHDQYKKKCFELGANYFFEKSADLNQVIEICKGLIPVSKET